MKFEQSYGGRQDWKLEAVDDSYTIKNPGPDGHSNYYRIETGPYGNPLIVDEPTRGFPAPDSLDYVDAAGATIETPEANITGIILRIKGQLEPVARYSLTNAANQGVEISHEQDGSIIIEETRWFLRGVLDRDKNRIKGLVGFYGDEKPDAVVYKEMADLEF